MKETLIVGLEVHVQLLTKSKIFCGCPNRFNPDAPNTQTCPVCLGHPGALPVMNQEAFRLALITATALNCEIARFTKWDRKQYFYPDLPKGYQISQYDLPFSHDGWLEVTSDDGSRRKIRINRAHLEEDAGKNLHDESGRGNDSQVDLNRAGTPLLEIVSEPDIRTAAEAKSYLEELYLLLTFLGVSDCNMQEGSLRCDANINLHLGEGDQVIATPIVEIKNLNSFRAVEAAIEYEAKRQRKVFEETGLRLGDPGATKETRGWDAERQLSFAQRGKEEASDYRYFPDPDLIPVSVSEEQIREIREHLPEPPAVRRRRFEEEFGLSAYDADVIVNQGKEFANYFEQVVSVCEDGKQAANWVTQDVLREMKERTWTISEFPITAEILGTVIRRVVDKKITTKSGRELLAALLEEAEEGPLSGADQVDALIEQRGLAVVSDTGALEAAVQAAIAESPQAVTDFQAGKQQAVGAIIGKVMRQAKGADAKVVRELIVQKLQES